MSAYRSPSAVESTPSDMEARNPSVDPWQGWAGILGLTLAVLLFQVGCSAISNTSPLTGLGKNLVGRWERTGGTPEVLIFSADGSFVQLRGRTERLAREVDGWKFSTPSGGRWDVVVTSGSSQVGGFKCEFRDDDELEITDGTGLKGNLKGVYRRTGGGTVSDQPAEPGSIAEKLNELKGQLASAEKRRDELKKARVNLERQRLEKLAELRSAGVTANTASEQMNDKQKSLAKELVDLVKEDSLLKSKIDEMEATVSKIRTVSTRLNVKLVVEGNSPSAGDLSEIESAKVKLRMAEEELKQDDPPMTDPVVEELLKAQLAPKNEVKKEE